MRCDIFNASHKDNNASISAPFAHPVAFASPSVAQEITITVSQKQHYTGKKSTYLLMIRYVGEHFIYYLKLN